MLKTALTPLNSGIFSRSDKFSKSGLISLMPKTAKKELKTDIIPQKTGIYKKHDSGRQNERIGQFIKAPQIKGPKHKETHKPRTERRGRSADQNNISEQKKNGAVKSVSPLEAQAEENSHGHGRENTDVRSGDGHDMAYSHLGKNHPEIIRDAAHVAEHDRPRESRRRLGKAVVYQAAQFVLKGEYLFVD